VENEAMEKEWMEDFELYNSSQPKSLDDLGDGD